MTSKAIAIQNMSGDNLYLGYGRRDDSTNSSQMAGLILENEDGNKFWLFLNPIQDKQHGGSGSTTWTVDYNISFTGSHLCVMKKSELEGIQKGMIVSSTNDICNFGSGRDFTCKESIGVSNAVPVVEVC